MSLDHVDSLVIGAGVVGLAVARALAQQGRDVIIVEAAKAIGTETSSHNSEVIHAGIYYARNSLKAELCVEGRKRLYAYCAEHNIPHKKIGKIIVATSEEQTATLHNLRERGVTNGVHDLIFLGAGDVRQLEPHVRATAGLLSPSSGIVDSHALMLAYLGDAEDHGAMLALETPVVGGKVRGDGIEIALGGQDPTRVRARLVVNCAGLKAHLVAASIEGMPPAFVPRIGYAKGSYFSCNLKVPFGRLVYPVPEPGGLGVHVTFDLGGRARFGPDVEWIDVPDYSVNPARAKPFYEAIRRYWPSLPDDALQPDYAGIRVKLLDQAEPDFVIQGPAAHGVPGLVNLFGIESPGLTSSLAIAERVVKAAMCT